MSLKNYVRNVIFCPPCDSNQVQTLKQKFISSLGLPFRDLLPESTIIEVLAAEKITYRRRLFDPFVTLWAFLSQVLDADKSCANAVTALFKRMRYSFTGS